MTRRGMVIQAFGEMVMAGSVLIGGIIFAILTIINFVVITKGSGRIAEVSARFSARRDAGQADGDRRRSFRRPH